ncbi:SCO family protein [Halobacillus litoralis]|uniref:SCO family protein n=1 Tax=Halobacillus litoralis TaxID=45668 RepID=UPI001CD6D69D|nr:SCO family protein [Halobacillus litoralis]MCA0972546.1 SCO family protein [Halobacillus litoralis]
MKRWTLFGLITVLLVLLAACGSNELENTLGWEVGTLEATTHQKENFSTDDMEGQVWIADFIFTSCNTVCPPMTRNMMKVQEGLKDEGVDAQIISFSVDPTVDTPDKLAEFGSKYGADMNSNWTFVTGYNQETIADFANNSFKTHADKIEGNDQVIHGNRFYLVGKDGTVLKRYNGSEDVPFEQIIADTQTAASQ